MKNHEVTLVLVAAVVVFYLWYKNKGNVGCSPVDAKSCSSKGCYTGTVSFGGVTGQG